MAARNTFQHTLERAVMGFFKSFTRAAKIDDSGKVPIVLGVTGHRDIACGDEALSGLIAEECSRLMRRYPHTPFLLLSGMAEGADRLVARVALERLPRTALIAVLPMPRADYERDFASDASRAEFAALMAKAESVLEIAPPEDGAWKSPGEARNILYARAGAVIAEHAQILFALWDGGPGRGTGGTASVVEWFKDSVAPKRFSFYEGQLSPLDPPEPGLLLHITPKTLEVERIITKNREKKDSNIEQILQQTEQYNRAVHRNRRRMGENYPLLPGLRTVYQPSKIEAEYLSSAAPDFRAVYDAADTLAVKFAKTVRSLDRWLYIAAVVAFAMFALMERVPAAVFGYFAVAGLMFALWYSVKYSDIDNRFLEYRGLAEAMRVLFFWRLAGVKRAAWLSYLPKHSGVITWVRHAVRAVEFREAVRPPELPLANGVKAAHIFWISSQQRYYENTRDRLRASATLWRTISRWSLYISYGLAAALAVMLAYSAYTRGTDALLEWDENTLFEFGGTQIVAVMQLAFGVLAAAGIAVRGYLARKADEELVKQYSAAFQIFSIAARELDDTEEAIRNGVKPDWTYSEILERLGVEALTEHGEWLVLRHSRPFDLPK